MPPIVERRIDGDLLRAHRISQHLSPSEVADGIVSRPFYHRLESGERGASPKTARALAYRLGVPLDMITVPISDAA